MERRQGIRYPVHLDCRVFPFSRLTSLAGQTVNMCKSGVLVVLNGNETPLEVGEYARVVLELPKVLFFRGCWLDCWCEVVRITEQPNAALVAFTVKRWQLRRIPEESSKAQGT